jgi:hypothetical protein
MKIALMLVGNVRTFDQCKESFKKTFGDIDIFISTYDLRYCYHPVVKNNIGDTQDEILTYDYLNKLFEGLNVKSVLIERDEEITRFVNEENSRLHPLLQNIHSSYAQYRKLKTCIDLVIDHENKTGVKYDYLIRARFDLMYNEFDYDIGEKELIHDAGSQPDSEFLNDQLFWTNRDDMVNISNFMMNEFYNPIYSNSNESPPHGLLRNAIKHNNLKRTPKNIVSYLLRKNGQQEGKK